MQSEKRVLGKGLSALISDNPAPNYDGAHNDFNRLQATEQISTEIALSLIEPNPWQPRTQFSPSDLADLKDSIIQHGVIQPIAVRKHGDKYQIIAGERRWQASRLADRYTIPAVILEYTDKQMLEVALVENLQRQDLNPIDEAKAFKRMMDDYNYTQEQISKKVGKSRSFVANSIRLLSLPEDVQERITKGELSAGHARSLIGKENASEVAAEIVNRRLNVRDAEGLRRFGGDRHYSSASALGHHNAEDLIQLEKAMSEALGMQVRIRDGYHGAVLTVNFMSLEQLDTLVQRLTGTNLAF